jgi:hypothetical protein
VREQEAEGHPLATLHASDFKQAHYYLVPSTRTDSVALNKISDKATLNNLKSSRLFQIRTMSLARLDAPSPQILRIPLPVSPNWFLHAVGLEL